MGEMIDALRRCSASGCPMCLLRGRQGQRETRSERMMLESPPSSGRPQVILVPYAVRVQCSLFHDFFVPELCLSFTENGGRHAVDEILSGMPYHSLTEGKGREGKGRKGRGMAQEPKKKKKKEFTGA